MSLLKNEPIFGVHRVSANLSSLRQFQMEMFKLVGYKTMSANSNSLQSYVKSEGDFYLTHLVLLCSAEQHPCFYVKMSPVSTHQITGIFCQL